MGYEEVPGVVPKGEGNLYCLSTDLTISKQATDIDLSNGLDWTSDNKIMYFIDSVPRKVYAFDFDLAAGTACKFCSVQIFLLYHLLVILSVKLKMIFSFSSNLNFPVS